jgi:hypothetical protein
MIAGMSVRKTALKCKIHRNTAFAWRHKILDALQLMADNVILDGIIEADETFFPISYKGNHKKDGFIMPRPARERGNSDRLRGISKEKVCVACAVDRNGMSISKISNLGRISTKNLHKAYDNRMRSGSTLCTDKLNSYSRFAASNDLKHISLKSGKSKLGIYNIQHINQYHSELKRFLRLFKGVSTKYLNNYLIWNNFVNYAKETYDEKISILLKFTANAQKKITYTAISDRAAIPLI